MDTIKKQILACLCGETQYSVTFGNNKFLNGESGAKVITCNSCHLIRTTPRPLSQISSSQELYQDKEYFAGARDNPSLWYKMQAPIIRDVQKLKKCGSWLDIGSGLGFLAQKAKEHGYQAIGIDLNESVVAEGVEHYDHPVSIKDLSEIKDESFDVISINHVLEHVESPQAFIRLAATKLKPEGILIIGVPNIKGGIPRLIRFFNRLHLRLGSKWLWHGYQLNQHLWHFTPQTVVKYMPEELQLVKVNRNDNMYYGFLTIKKLRYRLLAIIFKIFEFINMGDNLRIILRKVPK